MNQVFKQPKTVRQYTTVKMPFKVVLGRRFLYLKLRKIIIWVIQCRIQAEDDISLLSRNICFNITKIGKYTCYITSKLAENTV